MVLIITSERKHKEAIDCLSQDVVEQVESVMHPTDIDGFPIRLGEVKVICPLIQQYLYLLEMDVIVR